MTGIEIKVLRQKMMMTQTEFGKKLGVSRPTVSRWERDTQEPYPKHKRILEKLSKK